MVVGTLQVNARRVSRTDDATQENPKEATEQTKPISLVDYYDVDDSLLFKNGTSDQFVPYYKAWLIRVSLRWPTRQYTKHFYLPWLL